MSLSPNGGTGPVYGKPKRRYADNAMCSDMFVPAAKCRSCSAASNRELGMVLYVDRHSGGPPHSA